MNIYYVYEHWRPDTGFPFYVGKGKKKRAYGARDNTYHRNIVRKLREQGLSYEVVLVKVELSEQEAFDLEIRRIALWRWRGIKLTNRTDGGEGASNPPLEVREAIAAANRRRIFSDERRARMSEVLRGRKRSPEVVEKMRGRKHSPETIAKMSETRRKQLPRIFSAEARENIAAGHRGLKRSAEAIEKTAAALRGRKYPFRIWVTDGIINLRLLIPATIPEGWRRGRTVQPKRTAVA